jgi:hypothetical protein
MHAAMVVAAAALAVGALAAAIFVHGGQPQQVLASEPAASADAALERAEARLATGTYGHSIESGEPVLDERLEANPLAELTVEEERRLERSS